MTGITKAERIVAGVGFAEGPVCLPDGRLLFCDCNRGALYVLAEGEVSLYARTGGSPASALLAPDGAILVTQYGNVPGSGDTSAIPGIERITEHGTPAVMCRSVAGVTLAAPNDLIFGPDGRLYFTDSGTETAPGRIFAWSADGPGELLFTLDYGFINGIAFDIEDRLVWTETYTRRVCRMENGRPTVLCVLPEDHLPDGLAVAADGRLFVATLTSGGVTVLSPDGGLIGHIAVADRPTNCAFSGATLFVTCTRTIDLDAEDRGGSVWRVATDAQGR